MNTENKEQQIISIPLKDLIWNILGDELNGISCAPVTRTTAIILDQYLSKSLRWTVEFDDKDGNPLPTPLLWRYVDWKNSSDAYAKAKLYSHRRVIEWRIKETNINNLAKAIIKSTRMENKQAIEIASKLMAKSGSEDVLQYLGLNKIIKKEEEL
jgi:hypothetical protein